MTQFLTIQEAAALLRLDPKSVSNKMHGPRACLIKGVHWFERPGQIGPRFDRDALVSWVKCEDLKPEPDGIPMANGSVLR